MCVDVCVGGTGCLASEGRGADRHREEEEENRGLGQQGFSYNIIYTPGTLR